MEPYSAAPPTEKVETQALDFQAIFNDHGAYVWHSLRRLGIARADLEDLTHDVFILVYRQLHQYDPDRPIRPWLFAFAFRKASEYRRKSYVRLELINGGGDMVDPRPTALDRVLYQESLELGHSALAELDIAQRAVFVLHELDEVPIPEVAVALGIALNTAYSRLRLARAAFDKAVRRLRLQRGDA